MLPGCGSFLPEVLVDRAEELFLVGAGREPVEFVEEPGAGFLVDSQGLEEREGVGFERAFRVVVLASFGAGAPVVHVPLLLDVAGEEAVPGPPSGRPPAASPCSLGRSDPRIRLAGDPIRTNCSFNP